MNKVNQKVSQKIQGKPQGIIRSKKKHVKILQSSLNLPPKKSGQSLYQYKLVPIYTFLDLASGIWIFDDFQTKSKLYAINQTVKLLNFGH